MTSDPYFRLCTTMVGIVVTDAWKAIKFHYKKRSNERILAFANRLAFNLLYQQERILETPIEHLIPSISTVSSNLSEESESTDARKEKQSGIGMHTQVKLACTRTTPKVNTRSLSV